jgi:hypothetical protein
MSDQDVIPDRDQLRAEAVRRTRRGWWPLAVLVGLLVLIPVVLLAVGAKRVTGGLVVALFLPPLVAVIVGAVVLRQMRRNNQDPGLLAGASRDTRRAATRALRTGHAPDARIDALARDLAARTVRRSWQLILYWVLLAIQLALLTLRIVSGDPLNDILLAVGIAVLWIAILLLQLYYRSRSRRYLRTGFSGPV